MKRILSGVQATGKLHIGNYLGAMKQWVKWQDKGECIFFIPDLHSLNIRPKPQHLKNETLNNVAWLLACGINPDKSIIYAQSHVSANSELCWILNNYVTMGELNRMTQFKEKSQKRGTTGQLVGLFDYPVLMAADILAYSANIIPVGEDQRQHVELTRDIAERFNNIYGKTFIVPEAAIGDIGSRVMNLADPENKMSKSDNNQNGNVLLFDKPETIKSKIARAVTDSGSTIEASDNKPAITNLLQIYAGFSDRNVKEIEKKYANKGYKEFKTNLADLVADKISELQKKFEKNRKNQEILKKILEKGAQKANIIASKKLVQVKERIGLI